MERGQLSVRKRRSILVDLCDSAGGRASSRAAPPRPQAGEHLPARTERYSPNRLSRLVGFSFCSGSPFGPVYKPGATVRAEAGTRPSGHAPRPTSVRSSSGGRRPDARSDIYSVGAIG
jgi:hypothetical protein